MQQKMNFSNSSATISNMLNKVKTVKFGGLDLRPEYQRGFIWKNDFKDKLIYSIIKDYPIGNISIRVLSSVEENPKGAKSEVVDGQQRLSSIRDFRDDTYIIKSEWSRKIILIIKDYYENAGQTDEKVDKLIRKLSNKGMISLKFSDLPDIVKGNFDNYDMSVSYIADASDLQIREYFRFLQNQERLRAGEIINSMPPTNLEVYINMLDDKEKLLDIIGFSDDRKDFDKVFYSIIGLLDGKISFGTTDKVIQEYANNADNLSQGKADVERMILQLNAISLNNEQIIKTSRKRFLKYLLLLTAFGNIDFVDDSLVKLKELMKIDNSLSVFFSAKSGVEDEQFNGYSEEVMEEMRLVGLLSKGGHSLVRVKNRMEILAYYVNNPGEKTIPSGIILAEHSE